MRIRVTRFIGIAGKLYREGDEIDVEDRFAITLIEHGIAERVHPNDDPNLKEAVAVKLGVQPENVDLVEVKE